MSRTSGLNRKSAASQNSNPRNLGRGPKGLRPSYLSSFTLVRGRGVLRSPGVGGSARFVSSILHRSSWEGVPKASASSSIVLTAYRFNGCGTEDVYKRRKVRLWTTRR
jgi:hypothetical protein